METNQIPVLTFHALETNHEPTAFAPARFAEAITSWSAAGWRTLSLADAVRHLQTHTLFPARTYVLTFDDGYASVYQVAFPLLKEYNLQATVFVAPNTDTTANAIPLPTLHGRPMLHWHEILEMNAHGVDFGAHTLTHRDLTRMDPATARHELCTSQAILADALGKPVPLFAYPKGIYNPQVRAIAAQFFECACSDRLGIAHSASDLWALERVDSFYLQSPWAAQTLTNGWLAPYVVARNIPRRLRRLGRKIKTALE